MQKENERGDDRGAWLRIWQFPLVTMCVAATAMIAVLALSEWAMRFVPEGLNRNVDVIVRYGFHNSGGDPCLQARDSTFGRAQAR